MIQKTIMEYYNEIEDFFNENKHHELYDIFSSLEFKLNKNKYHFEQINEIIDNSSELIEDYYKEVHLPIYYEFESFLVSLRTSVDILLHLVDFSFDFKMNKNDITLYNIFHHKKLPKNLKNIFERYTRPYNNPTWTFIYTSRNEIVHEKSVSQILPITVDIFNFEKPTVFFEWEEIKREMITFLNQCLRFLETFATQFLQAIKISL